VRVSRTIRSPAAGLVPDGNGGDIRPAFIGSKLRTGASGLGHTPRDALKDFNWHSHDRFFKRLGNPLGQDFGDLTIHMKVPFTLGEVGHFGLAVRDPKKSAKWFERAMGLRQEFDFENGIAVGNENVTIALFKGKPSPETIDHMSFHLPDMATLRKAFAHLKGIGVDIEDSGDEIGPEAPGRKIWAFGSTIPTATDGSLACLVESSSGIPSRCGAVGTPLCAAHSKVPALTRYLRALAFLTIK
jgi:catechol 2,3-dioxygenase-like lactoylglutathione lyase family enzyme